MVLISKTVIEDERIRGIVFVPILFMIIDNPWRNRMALKLFGCVWISTDWREIE